MKTEYKIEFRKTIKPIIQSKWFYLQSVLFAIVWFVFIPEFTIGIWIFLFMVIVPIILQIILHINYYLHDKGISLEIDYGKRMLFYTKQNETMRIPIEKIILIRRFQGSKYPKPFDYYITPSNFYHYTVIETSDNLKIKFSDFIKEDIEIFGVKKKKIVIPFLNLLFE